MTVREALADAAARLEEAGCDSPYVDAQLLLEHVTSGGRADLYAASERELDARESRALEACLRRRCDREPLAYVLGEWSFRRLSLRVTPAVLVPRPETEVLVERCLARLEETPQARVLDIGTGSGAIALAIADERPDAVITAIDSSAAALEVARENAARADLAGRVTFVHGDLFGGQGGPFELVVSNPPYVRPDELARLQPEVRVYEPRDALLGVGFHERIAGDAPAVLTEGGSLVLECGEAGAGAVAARLTDLGWSDVRVTDDLAGRPRVVEGRRPAEARVA